MDSLIGQYVKVFIRTGVCISGTVVESGELGMDTLTIEGYGSETVVFLEHVMTITKGEQDND